MIHSPVEFDGSLEDFYNKFIEPNLPTPARVEMLDSIFDEYLSQLRPAFIVRMSKGMIRGQICSTTTDELILPGDNSPGWWLHARLLDGGPLGDANSFFNGIPTHIFEIGRLNTLNKAGYHLAHIINTGNGDTRWRDWDRTELRRRFLLNLHPCNWFLLARTGWREHSYRKDILDWIRWAYVDRYGATYLKFLTGIGAEMSHRPDLKPQSPSYRLQTAGGPVSNHERRDREPSPVRRRAKSGPVVDERPLNRPLIAKKYVGNGVTLNIATLGRHFRVPHDELCSWAVRETGIAATRSWREDGLYSWPKPSKAMLRFLAPFAVSGMVADTARSPVSLGN